VIQRELVGTNDQRKKSKEKVGVKNSGVSDETETATRSGMHLDSGREKRKRI